jgi:uncharacterized protein YuzE
MDRKQELSFPPFSIKPCLVDNEIKCVYMKISDGKVHRSIPIGKAPSGIIDLDKKGKVLGIELFEPMKIVFQKLRKNQVGVKPQEIEKLKNIHKIQKKLVAA